MEELVRSLRNLGLAAPRGEQIVSLVDADPRTEKQLAQELAVPARIDAQDDEDSAAAMVDAALLSGATEAMLANYNRVLQQNVDALRQERAACSAPKPVKRVPLKALLAQQNAAIRRREAEREAGTQGDSVYTPRQILDTEHTFHSTRPVSALTHLEFDELVAPKRFEGRYVVVRVASPLSLYVSCSFVGEFASGAAIPISIAYFTPNLKLHGDELDAMLPEGTLLLIREPYVSTHYLGVGGPITGGKGVTGIRVDTPSDVMVLDADDPLVMGLSWPTPLTPAAPALWRQEGPLARAMQRQLAQPDAPPALVVPDVSREAVRATIRRFLAQDRPGAAWREWLAAERIGVWSASGTTGADDALLHADVLLALRSYADAEAVLNAVPLEERDDAWTQRMADATAALDFGLHGPTGATLERMFAATLDDTTPRFSYAEFHGPIEVANIPGAGRGLVLTRDVEPGELLLCCRALGSSYSADAACDGVPLLRVNIDNGVTSTTTQVLAATRCIHAVLDRPEWATAFFGLTAGPDVPYSPFVSEPYPLRTRPLAGDAAIASGSQAPDVSAAYVNGVLRFNAFGPAATPAAASGNDPMSRSTMPHLLPAILNHACLPNVSSVFFGDMVTTRALHPLPRGTQIMHQYVQGELPYDTRQSLLAKHGFRCTCELCVLDERDGPEALRKRQELLATTLPPLVDRSRALLNNAALASDDAHREVVEALEALADALHATYDATRGALRPDVVDVLHRAAQHAAAYDVAHATSLARAGAEATGAQLSARGIARLPSVHLDGAIQCLLTLARLHADDADACRAWVDAAVATHDSMIGGGAPLFVQRYDPGEYEVLQGLA
ncbi:hypothetical protein GLX27_001176 [Malassezia furfur]|uniref:SET domain-containing protein n=1 Tax=Malassezia furfur TaxID=55194 RepID=A0ABY8ENR9_MALFU|nr:hypothetical protein GLX27_001176 [Malassezia furfur]